MGGRRFAGARPVLRPVLAALLILLVAAAGCAGCFLYVVSIERVDGTRATSAWPKQFTEGFSSYIHAADGAPVVSQEGIDELNRYGLGFALLGPDGRVALALGPGGAGETVFSGTWTADGAAWTYQIAFPHRIASVTMYLNGDWFQSGKASFAVAATGALVLLTLAALVYGLWARAGERLRAETERLREAWIADITHDLKAPLSPIRGYAELLADPANALDADTVRRYGGATLDSAQRALRMIDDLKLVYQIEGGSVPLRLERTDVARLARELVIETLNDPQHAEREIGFADDGPVYADVDAELLWRAVGNAVRNALAHNPPQTAIEVRVTRVNGSVEIVVRDDGVGLAQQEAARLFERYHRGAGVRTEGSGLGMSIVKQVVRLHGGDVRVDSASGEGTRVILRLPIARNSG